MVLLLTSYGIICQLAPPIIAALYWRRATTTGVIAGFSTGSLTAAFFFLTGYFGTDLRPFDLHEGLLGLIVHVIVLITGSLATKPQDSHHASAFVTARSEG